MERCGSLEGVVVRLARLVENNIIPTVGLIDVALTLETKKPYNLSEIIEQKTQLSEMYFLRHIVPVLSGMHTGF